MERFEEMVRKELAQAREGQPLMNSLHEGYAVILEEVDEFWEEVKKKVINRDAGEVLQELVQIAAMCQRTAEDVVIRGQSQEAGSGAIRLGGKSYGCVGTQFNMAAETPEEDKEAANYVLVIHTDKFQVGVKRDGTIEYSEGYTPDAAAKALWEAISGTVEKANREDVERADENAAQWKADSGLWRDRFDESQKEKVRKTKEADLFRGVLVEIGQEPFTWRRYRMALEEIKRIVDGEAQILARSGSVSAIVEKALRE